MNAPQKDTQLESHWVSYPRFVWRSLVLATDGSLRYYAWLTVLTALALVGLNAWAVQVVEGMSVTGMSDHVSWGLYIANFTFMVGVAAGGVMMVIPAYVYSDRDMKDVVIIGEMLSVAAIVMALAFVIVDMGRPDRLWHMMPGIGRFHWPVSMLTWDVVVLSGYLLLNLHVVSYMVYTRALGRKPDHRWYVPFVLVSIVWAISIHTVTAFLYAGLGGRPFWNSALLAPRFLVSAFVAGPAFLIITMQVLPRVARVQLGRRPLETLVAILRITTIINLFMVLSEVFTAFYTGGAHAASAQYLFFGAHGHYELVPWIWTAVVLNVGACLLFLRRSTLASDRLLILASVMTFVGCWIEKGMGLIVPGFIPSTLHEVVPYTPSLVEWKITVGIWALGLLLYTLMLKMGIAAFTGRMTLNDNHDTTESEGASS